MGDYRTTLNLPKTDFPMRASLPAREPERLARWEQSGLYRQIRERRRGAQRFILHDGPPYANGEIHMGHALNKTLKDIIVRYKTMRGYDAPYVPGWDCHGLPIEHQLLKEMGKRKEEVSRETVRQAARAYAEKYVGLQREGFQRLGILGDWANPYLTMDHRYQAAIAECFLILFERGFIERRLKPVPWCAECETALAEAELEYEEKISDSIYVTFQVDPKDVQKRWPELAKRRGASVFAVVWTTTPWTLPANVGLAFHPGLTYCVVDVQRHEHYLVAKDRLEALRQRFGWGDAARIVTQCLGDDLEGLEAQHPFLPRRVKGVLADFVSSTEGTGVVHIAPGHGEEDYQVGHLGYGLKIVSPVDHRGRFTKEFDRCFGQHVFASNRELISLMKRDGMLLGDPEPYRHSYPHCWRCKQPVIFRATQQWFLGVDHQELRRRLLDDIQRAIHFIPAWGKNRLSAMVESRPDWCLSRQRYWGVPIPIISCAACGKVYAQELQDRIVRLFREQGADVWFERPAEALLGMPPRCCGAPKLQKEEDIIDVWFDSGASHHAVLVPRQDADLAFPADLYLEGSDQHRGWFQTSLIVAKGVYGGPPFRGVLTHGFVVDGDGRKMSKSLGNVIAPQDVLKTYGADILRLWVASCDYADDVRLSPGILDQTAELYRKVRNTLRYLLGNLADFDRKHHEVAPERLVPVDRWAITRAVSVVAEVTDAYEAYEFHRAVRVIAQFCIVDLSNFYLDVLKDRLYTWPANALERRSAQTALHAVFEALVKLIAPLMPYTADEAWEAAGMTDVPSVHLSVWPEGSAERWRSLADEKAWTSFFTIRDVVLKALEVQRAAGTIGDPAEAAVTVTIHEPSLWASVQPLLPWMAELLLVSAAHVTEGRGDGLARAEVRHAPGTKCQRCWRYTTDVGRSEAHPTLCARCVDALAVNEKVPR